MFSHNLSFVLCGQFIAFSGFFRAGLFQDAQKRVPITSCSAFLEISFCAQSRQFFRYSNIDELVDRGTLFVDNHSQFIKEGCL